MEFRPDDSRKLLVLSLPNLKMASHSSGILFVELVELKCTIEVAVAFRGRNRLSAPDERLCLRVAHCSVYVFESRKHAPM